MQLQQERNRRRRGGEAGGARYKGGGEGIVECGMPTDVGSFARWIVTAGRIGGGRCGRRDGRLKQENRERIIRERHFPRGLQCDGECLSYRSVTEIVGGWIPQPKTVRVGRGSYSYCVLSYVLLNSATEQGRKGGGREGGRQEGSRQEGRGSSLCV